MAEFSLRLIRCARSAVSRAPELAPVLDGLEPYLSEPDVMTGTLDLSAFPEPRASRWERDLADVCARVAEMGGPDISDDLTFEGYLGAYRRGRLLYTYPSRLDGCRINVVPVPAEEIAARDEWGIMVTAHGIIEPISRATWMARVVHEPMTDLWTGVVVLDMLTLIYSLIVSDAAKPRAGYRRLADAFRSIPDLSGIVAVKSTLAEARRQLIRAVFPRNAIKSIPYGLAPNDEAIIAYRDMALDDLRREIGPSSHPLEEELRQSVLTEAVLAQCVGQSLLPIYTRRILNSP